MWKWWAMELVSGGVERCGVRKRKRKELSDVELV